jgi:hypothetical protein
LVITGLICYLVVQDKSKHLDLSIYIVLGVSRFNKVLLYLLRKDL